MLNGADETWVLRRNEIEGELTLDKIAVLARNRFVFRELEKLLKEDDSLKDNYFVKKSKEILDLESDLMKIFDLGTRIISNPSNQLHFQQILNYLKISDTPQYKNEKGIDRLSQLKSFLPLDDIKIHADFNTLLKSWQLLSHNFKDMSKALELLEQYADTLIDENEKELVFNDVNEEYKNTWKKFMNETISSNINLSTFRQFLAMGNTNSRKQKGLTLATVHTSKGLGFDIVFLMGMVDGTFPDYRAKSDEQKREERNTAYVAVTRAKRWLFVTYPKTKMTPWGKKSQVPSIFIR